MAQDPRDRGFKTVYEDALGGAVAFDSVGVATEQIQEYTQVVKQLLEDFKTEADVVEGLHQIERKLQALRISKESPEYINKRLNELITVPIAPGKTIRLDAFRKKAAQSKFEDPEKYRAHVKKLVRNTKNNINHLLLSYSDDKILERFMGDIQALDLGGEIREVKTKMEAVGKSPQLSHYNDKKKEFLLEWLRPYQEQFGKPVSELTQEEIQAAIKKVDELRDTKLQEMTHLKEENDHSRFRPENRSMHPIINGKNTDFWGGIEVRDEFVRLVNKLLSRFSLNLEDGFLLFKTKDEGFAYLVGFADEAFDNMEEVKGGKLAVVPHIKPFLKGVDGEYMEVSQAAYGDNTASYYRALKTAVVPFLAAMSVMLEEVLSKSIKDAFDMWV